MNWPWRRRDRRGLDDATAALTQSARELGQIEQRTPLIDELAVRAKVAADACRYDALDRKIRDALGGKHP